MSNRAVLIGWVSLYFLLNGCASSTEETNSAWSGISGGQWLTRISRIDTAGMGNGYAAETVQLKRWGANDPVDVVTLEENYGPATIKLHWRDPSHLVVDHTGGVVVFQVVKVAGVSIDTR
jgi:hypothetical protein